MVELMIMINCKRKLPKRSTFSLNISRLRRMTEGDLRRRRFPVRDWPKPIPRMSRTDFSHITDRGISALVGIFTVAYFFHLLRYQLLEVAAIFELWHQFPEMLAEPMMPGCFPVRFADGYVPSFLRLCSRVLYHQKDSSGQGPGRLIFGFQPHG